MKIFTKDYSKKNASKLKKDKEFLLTLKKLFMLQLKLIVMFLIYVNYFDI